MLTTDSQARAGFVDLNAKYPRAYPERLWFECGPGWLAILDKLGAVLEAHGVEAVQVKEKFGGLRVYDGGMDASAYETVRAAISAAEAESMCTCEECGQPGELGDAGSGWLRTSCKSCHDEHAAMIKASRERRP